MNFIFDGNNSTNLFASTAFFSNNFDNQEEIKTFEFKECKIEQTSKPKSPSHAIKYLSMNIKEQMSNFQIIKEGFEKKDQEIRVEELNSKRNNDGLEKEYIKLKEIFESEKRKITDYLKEVKASYEVKCSDYQKMLEEKDAIIETLQLDLAMIKDSINKKESEFIEEKQNKSNLLEQLSKKSEELKNELINDDFSLNERMKELAQIKENYVELSTSVSKFSSLFKAYQEKTNNYREEIMKLKKKYENIKMENVDLLVEKEKKLNEIETLTKNNEFIQEYFKNLFINSQEYLEKIENYKVSIDDFFMKFNNSINNQNVYKDLISKIYEEIKTIKAENHDLKVKIEESDIKIRKFQLEREEAQKCEQKPLQIINIKFYDEVKEKFQKVDQLIKYLAQEKIDALNEKNSLIEEINKMKKIHECNIMQKDRMNPGNNSSVIQENGGKEMRNEEKNSNNMSFNQEKVFLEEKKIKKETKNVDSFSGLKICGNCGFLVKKKDEFFNCRACDVFLHQDCPVSVNKEEVNPLDKTMCYVCQNK